AARFATLRGLHGADARDSRHRTGRERRCFAARGGPEYSGYSGEYRVLLRRLRSRVQSAPEWLPAGRRSVRRQRPSQQILQVPTLLTLRCFLPLGSDRWIALEFGQITFVVEHRCVVNKLEDAVHALTILAVHLVELNGYASAGIATHH